MQIKLKFQVKFLIKKIMLKKKKKQLQYFLMVKLN